MEDRRVCPNCHRDIEKSYRYCHRCGANIRLRQRSFNEKIEHKRNDRDTVRQLTLLLRNLVHVPILFDEHQDYIAGLHMLAHDVQVQIDYWQSIYDTYQNKLSALLSISIKSLVARLLRKRDQMINRLSDNLEYATTKLQLFKLQKNDLTTKLEMAYEDTTRLENLLDQQNLAEEMLNELMNKNSKDILIDQIDNIKDTIDETRSELIEIGSTFNRLQLATNYLMHASKILDQMEKQSLEPLGIPQILEEQSSITNLKTDKVNTRQYTISLVWTKLLAMYIYGHRLGPLTIVIPRAGTLSLSSYFGDIFPEDEDFDLEWIDDHSETIIAKVSRKSNYLSGMIERVRKEYDDLQQDIENKYNEISKLHIQNVK